MLGNIKDKIKDGKRYLKIHYDDEHPFPWTDISIMYPKDDIYLAM